jgi:hypothetical protein
MIVVPVLLVNALLTATLTSSYEVSERQYSVAWRNQNLVIRFVFIISMPGHPRGRRE